MALKVIVVSECERVITNLLCHCKKTVQPEMLTDATHTIASATQKLEEEKFDIVVIDGNFEDGLASHLISSVKRLCPEALIIVSTTSDDLHDLYIADGVFAAVLPSEAENTLRRAINHVCRPPQYAEARSC